MANKNQQSGKPTVVTPPAPAPAPAPAAAPVVAQGEASQSTEGDTAGQLQDTSAVEGQPSTTIEPTFDPVAALQGSTGGVVTSASDKVGETKTQAEVKAVAEVKAATVATGPFSATLQQYVDALSTNPVARNGFEELKSYVVEMKPGRQMNEDLGGQHQVRLYRTLQMLINNVTTDWSRVFGTLLALVHEFEGPQGAFGVSVFRFTETMKLDSNDRQGFVRLLNMLTMMADPKSRAEQLKFVEWERALHFGLTEDGRTRILNHFKL